jgi:hypothetical protein
MNFQTTLEIEWAIAFKHFGIRTHIIIPNVSWGFNIHECDLLVISKLGYLTEVEIKISLADLKKDKEKRHGHYDNRIKALYFAIPSKMAKHIEHIPLHAGILAITSKGKVFELAKPKININAKPISIEDRLKLLRLGTMRIWGMKKKLIDIKNKEK